MQDRSMEAAAALLREGSYSAVAWAFEASDDDGEPPVVAWIRDGALDDPALVAEALTCACWHGRSDVATFLLDRGVDPAAGTGGTGTDALGWAANRGHLDVVRLLIARGAPLETRNAWNATPLGFTVWSAVREPQPAHAAIADALLDAGARVTEARYPSGDAAMDAVLARYR